MDRRTGFGNTDTARYRDDGYRGRERMFSGQPNAVLVGEAGDLTRAGFGRRVR